MVEIVPYAATADILALVSRISDKGKTYMHACANGDHETADKLYAVIIITVRSWWQKFIRKN